jgi:hypothetical protein
LAGGFSQTEVIAYLKAKSKAAQTVIESLKSKQQEEDTLADAQAVAVEKPKEMQAQEKMENN